MHVYRYLGLKNQLFTKSVSRDFVSEMLSLPSKKSEICFLFFFYIGLFFVQSEAEC